MGGALELSEEPFQLRPMTLGWDVHAGRQSVGGVRNVGPRSVGQVSEVFGCLAEGVGCRSVQLCGLLGVRVVGVFEERCVFGIAVGELAFVEALGNNVGLRQVYVAGACPRDFPVEVLSEKASSLNIVPS